MDNVGDDTGERGMEGEEKYRREDTSDVVVKG